MGPETTAEGPRSSAGSSARGRGVGPGGAGGRGELGELEEPGELGEPGGGAGASRASQGQGGAWGSQGWGGAGVGLGELGELVGAGGARGARVEPRGMWVELRGSEVEPGVAGVGPGRGWGGAWWSLWGFGGAWGLRWSPRVPGSLGVPGQGGAWRCGVRPGVMSPELKRGSSRSSPPPEQPEVSLPPYREVHRMQTGTNQQGASGRCFKHYESKPQEPDLPRVVWPW